MTRNISSREKNLRAPEEYCNKGERALFESSLLHLTFTLETSDYS